MFMEKMQEEDLKVFNACEYVVKHVERFFPHGGQQYEQLIKVLNTLLHFWNKHGSRKWFFYTWNNWYISLLIW